MFFSCRNDDQVQQEYIREDEVQEGRAAVNKKTVRVTEKGPSVTPLGSVTPIVFVTKTTRTASPATSVEEIPTLGSKRPRVSGKEKEKVDSRSSTIWDDKRLAVDRAHEVVTAADLRTLSNIPLNEIAPRHVYRLVQVGC